VRLRRLLALRASVATCMSQPQIADALGVTQPAVFGSLARGRATRDSDIDPLVEGRGPGAGTPSPPRLTWLRR
jgi:predicted nucleotidyltransferase